MKEEMRMYTYYAIIDEETVRGPFVNWSDAVEWATTNHPGAYYRIETWKDTTKQEENRAKVKAWFKFWLVDMPLAYLKIKYPPKK
jgi:hypothetical protein